MKGIEIFFEEQIKSENVYSGWENDVGYFGEVCFIVLFFDLLYFWYLKEDKIELYVYLVNIDNFIVFRVFFEECWVFL